MRSLYKRNLAWAIGLMTLTFFIPILAYYDINISLYQLYQIKGLDAFFLKRFLFVLVTVWLAVWIFSKSRSEKNKHR